MGDSEMVGAVTPPPADADAAAHPKKKHHHKDKRKEAKAHQNNEGEGHHAKKERKEKKKHNKKEETKVEVDVKAEEEDAVQKEEKKEEHVVKKKDDEGEEDEDDDEDEVEEEEVMPAEEQTTTAATERKRRGTVSLYDMVAAEGNTIRRDGTATAAPAATAAKHESDEDEAPQQGSAKKTKAKAKKNEDDEGSSGDEEEIADGLSLAKKGEAEGGSNMKGSKDGKSKDRELALKAQKEKEREEKERERKKEKELVKEKKEKERKEREEKEKEERERREKEKLKEKERKREEKEKKKKEKLDKKAAKLKEKDAYEDLLASSTSATGGAAAKELQLEGLRRSSGNEDEARASVEEEDEPNYADEDIASPGSPQARFKDMMIQKYANVSSDPEGYRAHMTTNYFSKLAEQRRIKRSREEALKKIKNLSAKDYQTIKKVHERLLKEAREARRRRVKEGGGLLSSSKSRGTTTLQTVVSDLGPAHLTSTISSDDLNTTAAEGEGGALELKTTTTDKASTAAGGSGGRRSKFTKKYANSMPDMDRKAIRAGLALKDEREETVTGPVKPKKKKSNKDKDKKSKKPLSSDDDEHVEEEKLHEEEEVEEEDEVEEADEEEQHEEDAGEEGKTSRPLNSSKSAPKVPLSPKTKKDKDGASGSVDPEAFFDELYAICMEEESQDDVEKYLFVGRLLRDHELHKQEREQRLKRMIGLQTPENGSTLWRESEDIFKKPLSSFVCHRDFARLVRKYQIERPAGEILCGPFDLELPKTEATYTVLVTLAMVLDDTTLSEKIQVEFKQGNYLKSDEDLSDPTGLKVFFDEVIGEHTPLMRILKVTSQSIVAPCITKLKACMAPLDFNSVRNSWSIAIAVDNDEVTIVHTKKETATPDSEEKYGPFTFEWAIEYVFDLDMTSLKYMRPMLMNVRGSKKSRKVLKKAYAQLVSVKTK